MIMCTESISSVFTTQTPFSNLFGLVRMGGLSGEGLRFQIYPAYPYRSWWYGTYMAQVWKWYGVAYGPHVIYMVFVWAITSHTKPVHGHCFFSIVYRYGIPMYFVRFHTFSIDFGLGYHMILTLVCGISTYSVKFHRIAIELGNASLRYGYDMGPFEFTSIPNPHDPGIT